MMKTYRLLIFDWDGTLMDSEAHIVACMQASMKQIGVEVRDSAHIRGIIGLGLEEALQTLYPQQALSDIQALVNAYRYYFFSDKLPASTLFPKAFDVIKQLSESYDLAIATGKSRRGLDHVLSKTGLDVYFHITRCADETFSKPHPSMLEEILVDFDTTADQALMIGDSTYDLQMAQNINMDALAATYGVQHDRSKLFAHNPVGHIDSIAELPTWLAQSAQIIPNDTLKH